MDRGAWWAAVHGVATSRTRLSTFTFTFHFHALEGNGNPLQCSCLKNPRDGGAWWAAVYWVAQGRTRLKWLSSSSSSRAEISNFQYLQQTRAKWPRCLEESVSGDWVLKYHFTSGEHFSWFLCECVKECVPLSLRSTVSSHQAGELVRVVCSLEAETWLVRELSRKQMWVSTAVWILCAGSKLEFNFQENVNVHFLSEIQ